MNENEVNNTPDSNAEENQTQQVTTTNDTVEPTTVQSTNSVENSNEQLPKQEISTPNNNEQATVQTTNMSNNNTAETPNQENINDNQSTNSQGESQEVKVETPAAPTNNASIIIIAIVIGVVVLAGIGSFVAFKVVIPWYQTRQKTKKMGEEIIKEVTGNDGSAQDIINQASDMISDGVSSMKKDEYNDDLEKYVGTQDGADVKKLFDETIMKLKKDKTHTITVTYDTTITSDTTELTNLKQQIDDTKQYEVSMDYDDSGYINAITIKAL